MGEPKRPPRPMHGRARDEGEVVLSGHCSNPSEPMAKLLEAMDPAPKKRSKARNESRPVDLRKLDITDSVRGLLDEDDPKSRS